MRVLLDTCVLSEIRRPRGNAAVRQAVESLDAENLYLSAISVGEINKGINMLEDGAKKSELARWLEALTGLYGDRILPVGIEAAHIWGELFAAATRDRKPFPAIDGLIAATALCHGLHIMTRNTADFAATGALLINPWNE